MATTTATIPSEAPASPADQLREAFWRLKRSRIRISPAHTTRASSIGEPCERRLFYARTAGELARPHEPELQAIFDLGKELEGYVVHELEAMGAEVTQRERDYLDRDLELSAHADARVRLPGWPRAVTAEIKGLNPFTAEAIEAIGDIRDSRQGWVRKYYDQLQAYLMFDGGEAGLFVLLNKVSGQIAFIDCPRDEERITELRAKAARIRDAVRSDTAPERLETEDCARCPFVALCAPGRANTGEVQVIDSEEAEALIARKLELAEAKSEAEAIDRQLKKMLPEVPELIVGSYAVRAKKVERAGFAVKPSTFWQRTFVKIGGPT